MISSYFAPYCISLTFLPILTSNSAKCFIGVSLGNLVPFMPRDSIIVLRLIRLRNMANSTRWSPVQNGTSSFASMHSGFRLSKAFKLQTVMAGKSTTSLMIKFIVVLPGGGVDLYRSKNVFQFYEVKNSKIELNIGENALPISYLDTSNILQPSYRHEQP